MGADHNAAEDIYNLIGRFYGARSRVVHTGRLRSRGSPATRDWIDGFLSDTFYPTTQAVAGGIRKRLSHTEPIDWKRVTLG